MAELQGAHRACTRCVDVGLLPVARPVFGGHAGQRILLVGQAPGPVERDVNRPFAGRAGRQLVRWMMRAGFADEASFRDRVYIMSMTTCFPGRLPSGSGDRRPSAREVALCAPWMTSLIGLLSPRLIMPVGGLAISRFFPGGKLDNLVGGVFTGEGLRVEPGSRGEAAPLLVPLPHPSGQSRWLNDRSRADRLDLALQQLGPLIRWADMPNPD